MDQEILKLLLLISVTVIYKGCDKLISIKIRISLYDKLDAIHQIYTKSIVGENM